MNLLISFSDFLRNSGKTVLIFLYDACFSLLLAVGNVIQVWWWRKNTEFVIFKILILENVLKINIWVSLGSLCFMYRTNKTFIISNYKWQVLFLLSFSSLFRLISKMYLLAVWSVQYNPTACLNSPMNNNSPNINGLKSN